jgi:cytochrome P450
MNDIAPVPPPPDSGCPYNHSSAAFQPYFRDDLYADFAVARIQEPVFYCPEIRHWVVTKYQDALDVLLDPERYSAQNASSGITPLNAETLKILADGGFNPEPTQANMDPPRHTRIRNATNPLVNMRVAAKLEPQIRTIVQKFLDRLQGKTRIDLLRDFAYELPAYVMFLLLGIPEQDAEFVKAQAVGRTQLNFCPSTDAQQIAGAPQLVKLWNYNCGLVQDRLQNPQDDFISELVKIRNGDDAVITMNEVNTVCYGVIFAGHETTTNQLTNTFREMLWDRPNWEAICADPGLIPNAVEEGLRLSGAVIGWRRRSKVPVEIRGVKIPAGADIMLSFASANRDEEVFPNPDQFDVRRKNARKHLTLGNGIHFCLGAALARLEMKIVLEEFAKRFPNVRLVADHQPSYLRTFVFRAPDSLLVDLR